MRAGRGRATAPRVREAAPVRPGARARHRARVRAATVTPRAADLRHTRVVSPDASWSLSPGAIVLLGSLTGWYVWRWRQVDERPARLVAFLLGILAAAAALLSPIDILGEQLFTMHMVQHLLLLDVAALFIVLGLSRRILRPVTRRLLTIEQKAGFFATPVFAITLYVGTMWVWHIPALYDAALEHSGVHVLEHLCFGVAGAMYWWHIFPPIPGRHRLMGLGPAGYMLSTKVLVGFVGILLVWAPDTLYGFYEGLPEFWGLSHLEDQAIGGAIMALEQMIVMGAAFGVLFMRMLGESERSERRAERRAERAAAAPEAAGAAPRVHVAFDADRPGRVSLTGADQRAELAQQGCVLEHGMRLRLCDPAGREVDAVAEWDAEWGGWFAVYEPATAEPQAGKPATGARGATG
jgi:cytochrome c oxidase assembly factor CtaG